jgi:hypothetical protein
MNDASHMMAAIGKKNGFVMYLGHIERCVTDEFVKKLTVIANHFPDDDSNTSKSFRYSLTRLISKCRFWDNGRPMILRSQFRHQINAIYTIALGYKEAKNND